MTADTKKEFFESGRRHVDYVLATCRRYIDPSFQPQRVLDFGCGVGRLVIPFAKVAREVVGMDISPSMLVEARRNGDEHQIANLALVPSNDELSAVEGQFDLVHSSIVLQHIEVPRGRALFARLVDRVQPGGIGALHVTFGWEVHAATFGQPPAPAAQRAVASTGWGLGTWARKQFRRFQPANCAGVPQQTPDVAADPEMQMNFYNLSELLFFVQRAGVKRFHVDFTDHGGALGVFLFFQKPPASPRQAGFK
ncbi:MAG TPA: class I SAM-dependent methyltransferase [Albitalea sp.]|nr:class I SAM-dependent methyltransferase [Albitalea sp.]